MALQSSQHSHTRLEVELEFLQCLANPFYLNYLSHTKVLDDERFLNYLAYLEYFRAPEYAKLLAYPVYSLTALTLLKQPAFRADIGNAALAHDMLREMVHGFAPPALVKEAEAAAAASSADASVIANGTNGTAT